jgi:hypothetical protein
MPALGRSDFRIPDLRVLEVGRLIPHEQEDESRRASLGARLREAGVLRNPPVVTPASAGRTDRYVILDGANRASTLRSMNAPHIVAQVVRYEDQGVHLSTWHHAIAAGRPKELERALCKIPGVTRKESDLSHARALLARREAIAFLVRLDGPVVSLHGSLELGERNALLNALVDQYRVRYPYHRVTKDSIEDARARHPDVTSLIVFPKFDPEEILKVARSGARLPAGITRHVIPWRALRINLPLDLLKDRTRPLAEKDCWLQSWLAERMERNTVRFYEESTVLFDE